MTKVLLGVLDELAIIGAQTIDLQGYTVVAEIRRCRIVLYTSRIGLISAGCKCLLLLVVTADRVTL